jgi:hypothetical protein
MDFFDEALAADRSSLSPFARVLSRCRRQWIGVLDRPNLSRLSAPM